MVRKEKKEIGGPSFFSFRSIYLNGVQMHRDVPLRTRHQLSFTHYHCLQNYISDRSLA